MEELLSPVKVHHSRKRKKFRPSTSHSSPLIGILTRSKSRIYFHQNRSGISRPDPVPKKPKSFLHETESVEALLGVGCNNASRISSIKDLRMRRVFTPVVNSVLEEKEIDEETEDRKELLKVSDSSRVLDSNVGDAKLDELQKSEIMAYKTEDTRNDFENGLNLKDQGISGNGSNSKRKMALNSCRRRKVFKTSSSFSYKRLLPYLMDIANDDSSVTKIEIADAVVPCKLQKLDGVKSETMSFAGKRYTANVKCILPQFDDTNPSQNEGVQKFHTKMPFNQQGLSGAENELGQTAEIITPPEVEQKVCESDAVRVGASVEKECFQMTPPDAVKFSNTEVGHGGESMEEQQIFKGSEKSNGDVLRQSISSKRDANSISRSVLNPCSQLRLFNNPKSLSFRRLLPFLINISQNNSCDSRITQHPMPLVDLKKDTVEKNHVNDIKTEVSYEKQLTEDRKENLLSSVVPLPSSDGSSPETNNNPVSSMPQSSSTKYSSNVEPSLVTSEVFPEPLMPIDLHKEKMPQSHSDHRKLEPCFDGKENCTALPPSSTMNNDILNKQSTSKEPGPIGRFDLNRSSFQVEASDAMVSPAKGDFKGILKRNRRGCRGLCNCLNCASFRLHADRAFEFSRNQMHNAEEVASDLMKELAHLRFLLEKSITSDNDLAAIQLNPVLIKEAFNKALEAETLAKDRLSQLNYDLDVHCRIPTLLEPKVTFANYIQERAIPVLDPLSSTEKRG